MSILRFISLSLFLRLCLLADGLAAPRAAASSNLNANPQALGEALHARSSKHSVLLIDGDNVRGKTGFQLSKEQLVSGVLRALASGDGRPGLTPGRVVLFFDHGAAQSSFLVRGGGNSSSPVCVTFAGGSADDVIAEDVRWWGQRQQQLHHDELQLQQQQQQQQEQDNDDGGEEAGGTQGASVFVVTDDSGLKGRCRRAQRQGLHFVSSLTLATYLRGLATDGKNEQEERDPAAAALAGETSSAADCDAYDAWAWATTPTTSDEEPLLPMMGEVDDGEAPVEASSLEALVASVKQEQWVRGEIRRARRQLKHGCSRKKRTKLQKMLAQLEARAVALAASSPAVVVAGVPAGTEVGAAGEGAAAGVPQTRLLHHIVAGSNGHHASASPSAPPSASASSSSAEERDALLRGLLAAGAAARRGGPAKMGSGGGAHAEHTWERVVHAERLRLRLVQLAALPHHAAVTTAAMADEAAASDLAAGAAGGAGELRRSTAAHRWLREYAAARSAPPTSVVVVGS